MAAKKIGAVIALDGEKEFKQSVTECNRALSSLKSELGLVKAESDGQANSLESLTKKQDVLNRILDEQKNKEDAVREALEHATESYRTMGQRLETLRGDLEAAKDKLQEMKEATETSDEEMQQQEETVKELTAALKKSEANYQTAGNRVKDWETKLNAARTETVKASSEVDRNAAYMEEASKATDKCATSIDEYGKQVKEAEEITVDFGTVIKANLGNTVVDLVKNTATEAVSALGDMEKAQKQFQASTGASAVEMREYNSVMEKLHTNNYGEDINDIAQSMKNVKENISGLNPEKLEEVTENAIAMRDVFDMDMNESIRGVNALMTHMGLEADEAFDLMAKGAQNGLDKTGELGDNLAEYAQIWAQAGFNAEEMFEILDNGLQSGAYNLDKVNDFVKEFTISLSDGRIEENIGSFSDGTKILFNEWKQGKVTTKDVFYSIITDLKNTTNQQEALTIASNTWSSLGEDNAMSIITSLADVNTAYDDVKGTMEEIKDIKYDTLESRMEQLGKKVQTEIATPIMEDILPGIEAGVDTLIEHTDMIGPAAATAAASFATFKVASAAVTLMTTATEGATVAQTIFNAVCNANPVVLVATAVVGATTALLTYASTVGEASEEVKLLTEENQKLVDSANEVSESTEDMISEYAASTKEMKAQAEYAKTLAARIETLAKKESASNAEKEVMQEYIAELNELVPGLNLAYDEQADKINLTNAEIEKYLENSQKEIEMEAAKEHAMELIKQRTELEIESIKIKNEGAELTEKTNKLLEEENEFLMKTDGLITWIAGKEDERKSYKELTEAQEENSEALKKNEDAKAELQSEIEATQEVLSGYGISWEEVTAKENENTEATNANAEAQRNAASENEIAAQTIAETYAGMQETVAGVLESQMNMFEEFNAGTEISSQKLLENMQSQIDGVTNWADNMAILADRGVNQGILEKLAEMGPQGSTYVQAFANMTDEQLQQANDMWSQSLDMKEGVNASAQGMIEEYTVAINGGKEQVNSLMSSLGHDSVQGYVNAVNASKGELNAAGQTIGTEPIDGAKTALDSHSPSRKFEQIGKDVVTGMTNGITTSKQRVMEASKQMAQQLVTQSKQELSQQKFMPVGENISSGIARGINTSQITVILQMGLTATAIKLKPSEELESDKFESTGKGIALGLATGIRENTETVTDAIDSVVQGVKTSGGQLSSGTLYGTGLNVSYGLASGIRAGRSSVVNAVSSVCQAAVRQARSELKIHSPSKVFEELGSYTAEGFGIGYEKQMQYVNGIIADSMEIPKMEKAMSQAGGAGTKAGTSEADIMSLFKEYLPYLQVIAKKNVSLYPSQKAFREEIGAVASSEMGMAARRRR